MADAEGVHGKLRRDDLTGVTDDLAEQLVVLIKGPAAKTKTVKTDLEQGIRAALAQIFKATALNNGEDQWSLVIIQFLLLE